MGEVIDRTRNPLFTHLRIWTTRGHSLEECIHLESHVEGSNQGFQARISHFQCVLLFAHGPFKLPWLMGSPYIDIFWPKQGAWSHMKTRYALEQLCKVLMVYCTGKQKRQRSISASWLTEIHHHLVVHPPQERKAAFVQLPWTSTFLVVRTFSHGDYLIPSARCVRAERTDIITEGNWLAGSKPKRLRVLFSAVAAAA